MFTYDEDPGSGRYPMFHLHVLYERGQAQPPLGGLPMFSYLRYNVLLTSDWVRDNLGETLNDDQLKALEAMDEPNNTPELDRVGRLAGRKLVKAEHFEACFDSPRT